MSPHTDSPNPIPFDAALKPSETLARQDVIEQITAIAPHANSEFLARFTSQQLHAYLDHLALTTMPRGNTTWVRDANAPAVVAWKTPA